MARDGVFAKTPNDLLQSQTQGLSKPHIVPGVGTKEGVVTEVTVLPDVTYKFSNVVNQTLLLPLKIGDGF